MVAAFVQEARPWAMRQARRSYRHLSEDMHQQAYDVAAIALLDGAPDAFDRRSMYTELAAHLDDALRRLHVGWCLNSAKAGLTDLEEETADDAAPSRTRDRGAAAPQVADFLEKGLGGLERAVLQLELGAGRDTSVVRAALRLGPRQYTRHREGGLAKLRAAVMSQVGGRVCSEHSELVVNAATGDQHAADALASGPGRCRSCAREASLLRRLLHERLALAPWPLAIKPAGLLVAKLGALGAVVKGNGAAAVSSATTSSAAPTAGMSFGGAKAVATVLTLAAASGGTVAVVGSATPERVAPAAAPAAAVSKAAAAPKSAAAAGTRSSGSGASSTSTAAKRSERTDERSSSTGKRESTASAQPAAEAPASTSGSGSSPATTVSKPDLGNTVKETSGKVKETVNGVREATKPITKALPTVDPKILPPVNVDKTVDDVTGTVNGILP